MEENLNVWLSGDSSWVGATVASYVYTHNECSTDGPIPGAKTKIAKALT